VSQSIRLRGQEGIEAAILGGTELSLILRDGDAVVPLLDTTEIHVEAIVSHLLS
jgi:aspartate racemase